jgi:hypothetical protein
MILPSTLIELNKIPKSIRKLSPTLDNPFKIIYNKIKIIHPSINIHNYSITVTSIKIIITKTKKKNYYFINLSITMMFIIKIKKIINIINDQLLLTKAIKNLLKITSKTIKPANN